jgi:hypothetical protein
MLLYGLSLAFAWLGQAATIGSIPPECRDPSLVGTKPCHQPIDDVLAVTPGSFYTAKIQCYDSPYDAWSSKGSDEEDKLYSGDIHLVSIQKAVRVVRHQANVSFGATAL